MTPECLCQNSTEQQTLRATQNKLAVLLLYGVLKEGRVYCSYTRLSYLQINQHAAQH